MKKETKAEMKKSAVSAASTAAGAAAGVVIGNAVSPLVAGQQEATASETSPGHPETATRTEIPVQPETSVQPEATVKPETRGLSETHLQAETAAEPATDVKPDSNLSPDNTVSPEMPPQAESPAEKIEVVAYDRLTNEDGSQMDVAVLSVDGDEVGIVDVNLDGMADAIICDANHNDVIDEGEMQMMEGADIAMQPFQDAAGFDPLYAQNDLPDYVNDADVDTYVV